MYIFIFILIIVLLYKTSQLKYKTKELFTQCTKLNKKLCTNIITSQNKLCKYNSEKCIPCCERKLCKNINDQSACTYAEVTSKDNQNIPCNWNSTFCENCPAEYQITNNDTTSCYKNRCDGLTEAQCESYPFYNKCCWNKKSKSCKFR